MMDSQDRKTVALKELYPNFVSALGDNYYDADGNSVVVDHTLLNAKIAELEAAEPMRLLRAERNQRLANTDWWALSDLTMTDEQTAYRQALRDITETYTSLDDVVWPEVPQV
jgi:hypothetical protein